MHRPFVLHMALKDRWVQAEVNELLERRLSPNPLVTIHKYPGADHAFALRRQDLLEAGGGARAGADARVFQAASRRLMPDPEPMTDVAP
jgi:dienelactone hydrolase